MLNSYMLTVYLKYFFEHLNKFDYLDCYKFMKDNNPSPPINNSEEIEKLHYDILLNNKNISLENQYEIVKKRIIEFREYLNTYNLLDDYMKVRLNAMEELILPSTINYLNRRRRVRELRRGYK